MLIWVLCNISVVDYFCDSCEVVCLLVSSDVLLYVGDQEIFGLVVFEVMVSGILVVVVCVGVLVEIVLECCGVFCVLNNGDVMVCVVCELFSYDVELCGQCVCCYVECQYVWDVVVVGLFLYYYVVFGDSEVRFLCYG